MTLSFSVAIALAPAFVGKTEPIPLPPQNQQETADPALALMLRSADWACVARKTHSQRRHRLNFPFLRLNLPSCEVAQMRRSACAGTSCSSHSLQQLDLSYGVLCTYMRAADHDAGFSLHLLRTTGQSRSQVFGKPDSLAYPVKRAIRLAFFSVMAYAITSAYTPYSYTVILMRFFDRQPRNASHR